MKEWIKKLCMYMYVCIHTHTQRSIIQSLKKKEILPFATIYMNFEGIKLSKRDKDKYCMISWNLKEKTQKKTKRRNKPKPHRQRDQICGYQTNKEPGRGEVWGCWGLEKEFKRYKVSVNK